MSGCRLARRIALMALRQNTCADAGNGHSLATKVLHCSFSSFSLGTRGGVDWCIVDGRWRLVSERHCYSRRGAGVQLLRREGTTRRVALPKVPAATLVVTHSLVTKRKKYMSEGIR